MKRLRSESGSTVVIAIVLMTLMLMTGLATLAIVDVQQRESGVERQRESSLNLNEGVLYAQAFVLARNWPGKATTSSWFPDSCTSGAAVTPLCPDRDALASGSARANFTAADFSSGASWVTQVRDNGRITPTGRDMSRLYYPDEADLAQDGCPRTPCTLDANGDDQIWVQVRTVVRSRPRSVVALLKLEKFQEGFSPSAVTVGSAAVTNNGKKLMVDLGSSQISVRCTPPPDGAETGNACVSYGKKEQISPRNFEMLPPDATTAASPATLERLRDRARQNGTYYETCPPSDADLAGAVVWVANCNGHYSGNITGVGCPSAFTELSKNGDCINSPAAPGALIWERGTLEFTGNATFVGLVYHLNAQNSASAVLDIHGGFQVYGAVAIDGSGQLDIGSSGRANLKYDANAIVALKSTGTAGLVQNTWRELSPNHGM